MRGDLSRGARVLPMERLMHDFAALWRQNGTQYADDIISFGQDQWVVKNTGELLVWEPHQIEILRLFFTRGGVSPERFPEIWENLTDEGRARMEATPEGHFPWADMLYSATKKSGKTEVGGVVGLWVTLSEPGINEAFFVANDQEQSMGRGYMRIIDHLNPHSPCYNPVLVKMMRTKVKPNTRPAARLDFLAGDFVRAIPTDYAGESGANPTISLWDELWAYTRESLTRLWEEFTIVPTRRNSVRFVTTYAGFRDESELLWALYKRAVRRGVRVHKTLPIFQSRDGDIVAYWDTVPRMKWQTPEYYKREKASLRPNAYRRLHGNQWTRSESAFIDPDLWDALPTYPIKLAPNKKIPVYVGGDASHKRDCTAGVAVAWHKDGYPVLVRHQIWTPTKDEPVIPELTLGPWIETMCELFDVRRIGCDPNHMETLIYMLQRRGLPVEEYIQNLDNLTSAADALYTFTKQGLFLKYPETDLTEHVLSATAKETPRGWRLTKELARKKIDGAVALGTALALARQYGPEDTAEGDIFFILGDDERDEDAA